MNVKIEPVHTTELPLLGEISRQTFYDTFHDQNTEEDLRLFLETKFSDSALGNEMEQADNYFFFALIIHSVDRIDFAEIRINRG